MSDTELLPKSKSEPVRRLEVFTGAGRRRAWSGEQKAQIVGESYAGGEAVSAVARRHGLTLQQLFGWRRAALRGSGMRQPREWLDIRTGGGSGPAVRWAPGCAKRGRLTADRDLDRRRHGSDSAGN
jgi:hypothetical protein